MKCLAALLIVLVTAAARADQAATKAVLADIAKAADLENGSWDIKEYNMNGFDVQKAMDSDLAQAKELYPKCGPFRSFEFRRESIASIKTVGQDAKTAAALRALYNQDKIAKMYAIKTNKNIDCSQLWIEVYTTDGVLLELNYGHDD